MKILGALVAALLVSVTVLSIEAWIIMLVMGALHHEVSEQIPAFGFIACIWIAVALSILGGFFRTTVNKESKSV